jgi:hypothetical protein
MRGRTWALLSVVLFVGLLGALPAGATAPWRLPALKVTSEWPSWPHSASCGSLSFHPSAVFSEVPEVGLGNSPLDRALRRQTRLVGVGRDKHGWRLAKRLPGRAGFVRGQPGAELESGHELEYVEIARRHGRWGLNSYSQRCWLSTMRYGRAADTWTLAPRQPPLGPETRTVSVIAGVHCSRREKPPVLRGKPSFDEFEGKLVMTLWLRYRGGGANESCGYGLPPFPPIKVELPEPLGDRELFDGGEYPPRPATVYEEPTAIGL